MSFFSVSLNRELDLFHTNVIRVGIILYNIILEFQFSTNLISWKF